MQELKERAKYSQYNSLKLNFHTSRLSDREKGREVELEHEEIEATIRFPSAVIDELTNASTQTKSTKKMKKNNIEVSNPKASGADNNDELVTTMKNSRYSQNQRKNLQRLSYHPSSLLPIQADLSLYVNESTTDALLVRCFQIRKKDKKITLRIAFITVYYHNIVGKSVGMMSLSSFATPLLGN
ncbi:hypothetical protein H4Q26_007089 [Puccinia striiformis f. sp. tritici PST-130]|nr:hypothetical protein H4Q26_007089 [Puccinia striiformis f. sp. tritici PST-130]